ncbi:WhiB family transcriptional regulator [Microbispora sp. RL4-1S]|uniref:Transcriptional regulator WhiB n=1 Tax=Microbispora oryzae TaxID=2806554 RepID=A0A940WRD3_9ACTN|nr:WhiB family transcriptional regulator [Microbispora oryzae]MBP2708202.1 WhiB family transcriptional regulator [Microbispora oryzae]
MTYGSHQRRTRRGTAPSDTVSALFGEKEESAALLAVLLDAGPVCTTADADLFTSPDIDEEPDSERGSREAKAKAICAMCPARLACLNYALAARPRDGVWGGYAAQEITAARLGLSAPLPEAA